MLKGVTPDANWQSQWPRGKNLGRTQEERFSQRRSGEHSKNSKDWVEIHFLYLQSGGGGRREHGAKGESPTGPMPS